MRAANLLCAVCVGMLASVSVSAQGITMPDSAMRASMSTAAMKLNQPADFVLGHRDDLALSTEQVSKLNALARAMRDSAGVRQARMMSRMRDQKPTPATVAVGGWSGSIDEKALREEMCRSSANTVELVLALAHDRRAVAALLTPEQVKKLPQIQTADMMKAMKR